jgi:hypothetical protein
MARRVQTHRRLASPMKRNDRQRFVGWVMKLRRGGSGRSEPTIVSFFAAVAAVIVGLIGVGLTLLH